MDKRISAILNVKDKEVTFTPRHGARAPMSFKAAQGDKLVWELTGGDGLTAFITFTSSPSPLMEPQTLQSSGATITGTVRSDAEEGEHRYRFEVAGPGLPRTEFKCLWQRDASGEPTDIDMGGGDITGPPSTP